MWAFCGGEEEFLSFKLSDHYDLKLEFEIQEVRLAYGQPPSRY